jgi:hypothetical protein
VDGIRSVAGDMSQIASSSMEQSSTLEEVSSAIRQLDEITQRNAAMVEHAVEQAVKLEQRASTLSQAVEAFRLQQGTADEALAMVQKALQFRQQVGMDAFQRGLTDPAQGFHDRDMYVFALDRNGTYVAFGGNPAKIGTRVQDIPGIDGQGLVDAIVTQAMREPGWVEYDITNPATGGRRPVRRLRRLQESGGELRRRCAGGAQLPPSRRALARVSAASITARFLSSTAGSVCSEWLARSASFIFAFSSSLFWFSASSRLRR